MIKLFAFIFAVLLCAGNALAQPANQPTTTVDGGSATLGAKADAKSAATDTTPITLMSVMKQISASNQSLVTNTATNADPCSTQTVTRTPINLATAATTVLVAGVSAKKKYVCGFFIKNSLANNVALFAGHGTTCGTSPVDVIGGHTAGTGFILAANDGFVLNAGPVSWGATTVNADDLCIVLSVSSQVSGSIMTVDQ